jgi:hypothetical protein
VSDVTSDAQWQPTGDWAFKRLRYGGRCRQCDREIALGDWGWHSSSAEPHQRVICATCCPAPRTSVLHPVQGLGNDASAGAAEDLGGGAGRARSAAAAAGAGSSARHMAVRAEAKAAALRERATSLERYAANWRLGAEGEDALDAVLGSLVDQGWHPLPDRRSSNGGNIDELFVGPAGVAVLDAKNWSYPLTIRGERLRTGKIPRNRELDHVVQLVDEVGGVLERSSLGWVAVQGFMILCGDADRSRSAERVKDVWICGLDFVAHGFSNLPLVHEPHHVDMITSVVERGFPPILRSR